MAKVMDVPNNVLIHRFLVAKARTASETSAVFDRLAASKKVSGRALLVQDIGEYTSGTSDMKLQHSDATPAGGFADVSGAAFGSKAAAGFWSLAVDLESTKRYLRVVNTGSTPVYTNACYLMAPSSEEGPISNPAS